MLQIPLAALAAWLALLNAKNPPLCFYWLLVCAYWTLNAVKSAKDKRR